MLLGVKSKSNSPDLCYGCYLYDNFNGCNCEDCCCPKHYGVDQDQTLVTIKLKEK